MGVGTRELCCMVPVGFWCSSCVWMLYCSASPCPSARLLRSTISSYHSPLSFALGNLCMVTGGANLGRIGVITNRERHPGSFDVVHVKDANGNSFATRLSNIFVIGKVSLCGLKASESPSVEARICGCLL